MYVCVCVRDTHSVCILQFSQVDILDGSLKRAQTVAQLIFAGVAEAEIFDVAQIRHPDKTKILDLLHRLQSIDGFGYNWQPSCLPPADCLQFKHPASVCLYSCQVVYLSHRGGCV